MLGRLLIITWGIGKFSLFSIFHKNVHNQGMAPYTSIRTREDSVIEQNLL